MQRRRFLKAAGAVGAVCLAGGAGVARGQSGGRIRIGQIGTKHAHASGKMAAMRRLSDLFEVVGVVEPDGERRDAVRGDGAYAGLRWMTEDELLSVPGLAAVAVETEVRDLLATAERCVAAGKHVHLDKPAGESLPRLARLLGDAERRGLTVQMGYMFRYNPAFRLCYRAVEEGWLGRIFSVDAVMGKVLEGEGREALLAYPGGAMFELGCHVIDSVVRVLGAPERVTAFNRSSSRVGDGFADNQLAVLDYPSATATVRSSLLEVEGFARRQFVVCGDRGTLDIRPLEPPHVRLALDEPRGGYRKGYQDIELPRLPRYDGEFADLARVIRGESEFEWGPAHDLATQEVILRASGLPVD